MKKIKQLYRRLLSLFKRQSERDLLTEKYAKEAVSKYQEALQKLSYK